MLCFDLNIHNIDDLCSGEVLLVPYFTKSTKLCVLPVVWNCTVMDWYEDYMS